LLLFCESASGWRLDVSGLSVVHRFVVEHYGLEELRTLCFDLGANYDDLPGETLSGKARELILWAGRERQLEKLLAALRESRPDVFDRFGLSSAPIDVAGLYSDLAAFEESSAAPTAWSRFRHRPLVFYPTIGIVSVFSVIILLALLEPATLGGRSIGLLPALTATPTLAPTLTSTPSPTPTPTPIPLAFATASADEALVVIATFDEATGVTGVRAQDKIRRGIQARADEAGIHLRAEVEPAVLRAEDRIGADELGKRYGASMVIWGGIDGAEVIVNFLNLKQPDFDAASVSIDETGRTLLANPSAYSSFILHDLPGQMAFLSLFAVGQSYYVEEKYEDSLRIIQAALSTVKESDSLDGLAAANFRLGWLYQEVGKVEPAIAAYDRAISIFPGYADAYINRGNAHLDSGDLTAAMADYDQAIKLQPDYAEAYYNRGTVRYKSGDPKGSIPDFDQAIQLQPGLAAAYVNRGNARSESGDPKGAIADFDQAIQLQPGLAAAYSNRGMTRAEIGDLTGALEDYDQAIKLQPDYADAYNNRSVALYYSGNLERAIPDYKKVIDLRPDFLAPVGSLCWVYSLLQQPKLGLEYCEKAVQLAGPDDLPGYRDSRGLAYALLGKYPEAIADFEAYVAWKEKQPGDNSATLAQRRAWIDALKRGENPFTPEVLKELQKE
jgi:tetratricopeptide (TPR) repeat protein